MKTRTEKLPGRFITVQEIGPGLWVTLNISRVTRIDIVDVPSTDPHMPVAHCLTLLVMTDDEGEKESNIGFDSRQDRDEAYIRIAPLISSTGTTVYQ